MIKFNVITTGITPELLNKPCSKAENVLAIQVMKDTVPFVPFGNGILMRGTRVVNNKIVYPPPYSKYLYYGKVMVNVATGKGPMKITTKDGEQLIRWPKGAKLVATERDLEYDRSTHRQAQAFWFEASKSTNLKKWIRVAERVVKGELNKK